MKNEVTIKGASIVAVYGDDKRDVKLTRAQLEAALKEINEPEPITLLTENVSSMRVPTSDGSCVMMEKRDSGDNKHKAFYLSHPPSGYEWVLGPTSIPNGRSKELFIRKVGEPK